MKWFFWRIQPPPKNKLLVSSYISVLYLASSLQTFSSESQGVQKVKLNSMSCGEDGQFAAHDQTTWTKVDKFLYDIISSDAGRSKLLSYEALAVTFAKSNIYTSEGSFDFMLHACLRWDKLKCKCSMMIASDISSLVQHFAKQLELCAVDQSNIRILWRHPYNLVCTCL